MFDNVNLPDLDERLKNRKSKCRRCLDRMKKLLDQFAKNASYFLKSLYMLDKDIKSNGKDDVTMEVNMINNNLLVP